jgi:hypothetical protein
MTRPLVALALMLAAATAGAQELGRLFFTPEQRQALDARRKARVPDKPAVAPVLASPTTRVDGFVRRSGGPSTVWVNGESLPESTDAEGPRIERGRSTDSRVSIGVGNGNARARLKPGQVIDRGTGEVRDVLGSSGEIRVKPGR